MWAEIPFGAPDFLSSEIMPFDQQGIDTRLYAGKYVWRRISISPDHFEQRWQRDGSPKFPRFDPRGDFSYLVRASGNGLENTILPIDDVLRHFKKLRMELALLRAKARRGLWLPDRSMMAREFLNHLINYYEHEGSLLEGLWVAAHWDFIEEEQEADNVVRG